MWGEGDVEEGEGEDGGRDKVRVVYMCGECKVLSQCTMFTRRSLQGQVRQLNCELEECRGEDGGGCEEVQAALEEALREKDLLKQQLAR